MKSRIIHLALVLMIVGVSSACAQMDHSMHGQTQKEDVSNSVKEENKDDLGICPVMGGKAVADYSYEYEGKTYNFCCPGCLPAFKEDPEKYIKKMEESKNEKS